MQTLISLNDSIEIDEVAELYSANGWSSAEQAGQLISALRNSHSLVTARINGSLVGLGNAISDGYLVVYFPHMLVQPEYQNQGIGRKMMDLLLTRYKDFHQLMLTADSKAVEFYESVGFTRAGSTVPMWIYSGSEH